MGNLVADTDLTDNGNGAFGRMLHRDWEIWGPNGGYMAALALRAAARVADRPRPANISVHFLGVASFDEPVEIVPVVLRTSKVATSIRVSIVQGGRPILEALVWAIDADVPGLSHSYGTPPEVEPHPDLPTMQERMTAAGLEVPPSRYRFWDNFEQRPPVWIEDWDNRGLLEPVYLNWMRFLDGEWSDSWLNACRLVLLVDLGGWPAADRAHVASGVVAPSIDVSCEFHDVHSTSEWLLLRGESAHASGGLIGSAQQVWSADGQLLASGISHLLCRTMRA